MRNDDVIKLYIQRKFGPARHACTKLAWIMLKNFLKERVKQPIHKFKVPTMDQIETLSFSDYMNLFLDNKQVQFDTHIVLNALHPSGNITCEDLKLFLEAYKIKLEGIFVTEGSEEVMNNINSLIKEFEELIDLTKRGKTLKFLHKKQFELVFDRYIFSFKRWMHVNNNKFLGRAIGLLRDMCNKSEDQERINQMRWGILKRFHGGKEALAAFDRELLEPR